MPSRKTYSNTWELKWSLERYALHHCSRSSEYYKKMRKLSFKSYQKIELLTNYIFPRLIYNFLINPPSEAVLKMRDNEIRQEAKNILHFTSSTATGFSYIPKANGGLGASRFEHTVRLGTLRRAIKIKNSLDPTTSSLIDEKYDKKLKSIANSLRLN